MTDLLAIVAFVFAMTGLMYCYSLLFQYLDEQWDAERRRRARNSVNDYGNLYTILEEVE